MEVVCDCGIKEVVADMKGTTEVTSDLEDKFDGCCRCLGKQVR